ncbi:MAG: metalloregulator ArsR/SmtB family transcription factor [Bacteroidota bacterium]
MTYAKTDSFSEHFQQLAELAKVLSHPARLTILDLLSRTESCISGDITQQLPLSRTTISQHLQELKRYGLIKGEVTGNKIYYCIDKIKWEETQQQLMLFLQQIDRVKNFSCKPKDE